MNQMMKKKMEVQMKKLDYILSNSHKMKKITEKKILKDGLIKTIIKNIVKLLSIQILIR